MMKKKTIVFRFDIKNVLILCSILCGTLGTYIIWSDSQDSISVISNLLESVANKTGFWQDDPIPSNEMKDFNEILEKASILDKRGFYLLMIGFGLQTVSLFDFRKEIHQVDDNEPE